MRLRHWAYAMLGAFAAMCFLWKHFLACGCLLLGRDLGLLATETGSCAVIKLEDWAAMLGECRFLYCCALDGPSACMPTAKATAQQKVEVMPHNYAIMSSSLHQKRNIMSWAGRDVCLGFYKYIWRGSVILHYSSKKLQLCTPTHAEILFEANGNVVSKGARVT